MPRKREARQSSGGARMLAAGRKPMLLGLTPEQHDLAKRAAEREGLRMTQLAIRSLVAAAKKILAS